MSSETNRPPEGQQNPDQSIHESTAESRLKGAVERAEHKEKLYADIGRLASDGTDQRSEGAEKPRGPVEKLVSWRIARKAYKNKVAITYAKRAERTFGPDTSAATPSVRKAALDTVTTIVTRGEHTPSEPSMGIKESAVANTKRAIVGPDIDGTTKLTKKVQRGKNIGQVIFGDKLSHDARLDAIDIKATQPKLGNKTIRRTRKKLRKTSERLESAQTMPISSRRRRRRLEKARNKIDT